MYAIRSYYVLFRISRHVEYSFLFSSLYLFTNAFILQSRSAMLESTQMFFIFGAVLWFLILFDKGKRSILDHFVLGILIGLAVAVKLNGLILILLYPFLHFYYSEPRSLFLHIKVFFFNGLSLLIGLVSVFAIIFYMHFTLANTLGSKQYKASAHRITSYNVCYTKLLRASPKKSIICR